MLAGNLGGVDYQYNCLLPTLVIVGVFLDLFCPHDLRRSRLLYCPLVLTNVREQMARKTGTEQNRVQNS